jgi:hypothetical protein
MTPTMKKEIEDRIKELGGKCDFTGQSLQADLESISFDRSYLRKDFAEYLQDEVWQALRDGAGITEADIVYPRISFIGRPFTPFRPGAADYEEWHETIDETYVSGFLAAKAPDMMYIGQSDGFPNFYFVNLADPNPGNPTVYTTDHEVFFSEIIEDGTLEEYFDKYVSPAEFEELVKQAMKSK